MTGQAPDGGFTLLEVLVALTILAIVGITLAASQRTALTAASRADGRAQALAAAASLLAERSAGARGDGAGTMPPDIRFTIASRPRSDLVRVGAPITPIERVVTVTVRPRGAARLAMIDWLTAPQPEAVRR